MMEWSDAKYFIIKNCEYLEKSVGVVKKDIILLAFDHLL